MMRRAEAIVVLLALAALPLVPLVQASQSSACTCGRACCMRRDAHPTSNRVQHETKYCQDAGPHACGCGMMSRTGVAFALAPIPLAFLSSPAVLAAPAVFPALRKHSSQRLTAGFSPDLFEPPRS